MSKVELYFFRPDTILYLDNELVWNKMEIGSGGREGFQPGWGMLFLKEFSIGTFKNFQRIGAFLDLP